MTPAPESILVYVGGDLVGDAVMKLPFVRALRTAWPEARITWCAGHFRSAFAHELAPLTGGLIDEVIEDAGIGRRWGEILHRPLPDRRFDLIVDTQRRVPTTLILKRLRHARFVSACANYLFSDVRPPGAPLGSYGKPPSMIGQMLELVALARFGRVDAELDMGGAIELPAETAIEARRLLPDGATYIGLAPGAGDRRKCWPLDNFISLAKAQAARNRVPVFVLGPGEADMAPTLRSAVPDALFPTIDPDGSCAPSIQGTIALGARFAAAVANDAGAGHILAAADVPMVSLFGPTRAAKFAPSARRHEIIAAQSFGADEMDAIPVAQVAAAVDRLASAPQRDGSAVS